MAKGDKFYFDNYLACAALAKKAAAYLVECLENYDPDNIAAGTEFDLLGVEGGVISTGRIESVSTEIPKE